MTAAWDSGEVDRLVMKPTARRRLGKYVLLGRLGHGGMGKIYLAHAAGPAGIEKLLVIKRLHSHLSGDQVLVDSFLDEARLSMVLNHPNIVQTFDVGDLDGRFFMVMEYIDGQNLGVVLRSAKRTNNYASSAVWATLFIPILDGLHAAHTAHDARGRELHIIHRDVSPQNILVTYEGTPKLVDFGIAKAAQRVQETDAGVLKGKYAYMSPEQVRGESLDARSDIFAAGIVLWEMLAARRLYKADTIVRSVERIMNEPPISPMRVNPEADEGLSAVCVKAIQKDRELRFSSAAEFRDALDEALQHVERRPRLSEVRELMQVLFADVMRKQREVLDQAFSAAEHDDHEHLAPLSATNKVARQAAHEHESTTPSRPRSSPLMTSAEEGSGGMQVAELKVSAPMRVRTGPTKTSPASEHPLIEHDEHPDGPTAPSKPSLLLVPRPGRSRALAAGVFLFFVVAIVGMFFVLRDAGEPDPSTTIARSTTVSPREPPEPSAEPPTEPRGEQPVEPRVEAPPQPVEAPVEARAPEVKPEDAAPVEADPVAPKVDPPPAEEAAEGELAKPRGKPVKPAKVPRATRPDVKPVDKADPPAEEAVQEPPGFLTLDTIPWTTVFLGKKKLGETPLVRVPVPSGSLELTLVNTQAGVRETYVARVKPGDVYKARLDLQ